MTVPELAQRAVELERKISNLRGDVDDLPVHAPKRTLAAKRLEDYEREYSVVMRDLHDAQGQQSLFD